MRLIVFILITFVFSCNRNDTKTSECSNYPARVQELEVCNLYDTAQWVLYNWLCDRNENKYYYSQMELRFKGIFAKNDSIGIFFLFYSPDTLSKTNLKPKAVAEASVAFQKSSKKKLWAFVYPFNNFSESLEQGKKELDSPPSDKALQFIKLHRDSLNHRYRELAIKLKILKE